MRRHRRLPGNKAALRAPSHRRRSDKRSALRLRRPVPEKAALLGRPFTADNSNSGSNSAERPASARYRLGGRPWGPSWRTSPSAKPGLNHRPPGRRYPLARKLAGLPLPIVDGRVRATVRGNRRSIGASSTKKAPATAERFVATEVAALNVEGQNPKFGGQVAVGGCSSFSR